MNINFMRMVDRCGGVPLCFLLSIYRWIKDLFFGASKSCDVKKILIVKPSELGGIILSFPLIEAIKKQFPGCRIFYATFTVNQSILNVFDTVAKENILTISDKNLPALIKDTIRFVLTARRHKIDLVIDLEFFSRYSAILSYLTGAPKRVGFYKYSMEGLYRGRLFTHNIQYNSHLHVSKMFFSIAQALKEGDKKTPEMQKAVLDQEVKIPRFLPSSDEKNAMLSRLQEFNIPREAKIVLVNPGEWRLPLRDWPKENFLHLIGMILENKNNIIIMVGTEHSSGKARDLIPANGVKNRYIDLTGKTTIREFLTLCTLADALVANDSGIAHLASLTEIQQFLFFGPETPSVFAPLGKQIHVFYVGLPCSPCLSAYNHRKSFCQDNLCLKAIKPEDVFNVLNSFILSKK